MSYSQDGITYNGLGEPLPWEADLVKKNAAEPKNSILSDKLKHLKEEIATASPERREAIKFQTSFLLSGMGRKFPVKDNYDIMKELVEKENPPVS